MSRYRKVITGEVELPEIDGNKFLIYPTLDHRKDLLDLVQKAQVIEEVDGEDEQGNKTTTRLKGNQLRFSQVADICAKVIFEGCFEHDEKGNRKGKKEGEEDMTFQDIQAIVLNSKIFEIFVAIQEALNFITKERADFIRNGAVEEAKN